MLLAMILFLKFGFSFLSQIPFLMHPTVRYKARHINTIHSPERSCLLSFPMLSGSVLQPAIPRKPASIHCAQSSEVSVPVIHPDYFSFSSSSSSSQNKSSRLLSKIRQILRHSLIVGLYSPFSIAFIVCREIPAASANAFCVISFCARATLIAIFFGKLASPP